MQQHRSELHDFFGSVQTKAFKQICFSIGDREEAMDLLQDAMIKLAQSYADQRDNWPRLFQRIVQNLIRDWYRRQKTKSLLFWLKPNNLQEESDESGRDVMDDFAQQHDREQPDNQLQAMQVQKKLGRHLARLPQQQQQAFILRAWWEHSVEDAAFAMGCSAGSVKTHYFRACKKLRECIGEDFYE